MPENRVSRHAISAISGNIVPGYTTDMFLIPRKNLAIAMVMNTYSPMLGIRVSRLPASGLRMLLGQSVVPGYEFRYMQIVYAGVMLVPLLQLIAVVMTFGGVRSWQLSKQRPTQTQAIRILFRVT